MTQPEIVERLRQVRHELAVTKRAGKAATRSETAKMCKQRERLLTKEIRRLIGLLER